VSRQPYKTEVLVVTRSNAEIQRNRVEPVHLVHVVVEGGNRGRCIVLQCPAVGNFFVVFVFVFVGSSAIAARVIVLIIGIPTAITA